MVGNALVAFTLLSRSQPVAPRLIVLMMGFVNLSVVLLFMPFEDFPWAGRTSFGSFGSFYFGFGGKVRRQIFMPMLTLELIYVLINACPFWLMMGIRERRVPLPEPGAATLLVESFHF